ncbi:hypothetical protein [Sulfurimonas sp.]|uniref:hypothetical protein n=1 Tax=Sulfurimonas sp. TaxID=2022749 RepID=UPI002B46E721|nr:hypothetical protein [Sulfurimonas sp.]
MNVTQYPFQSPSPSQFQVGKPDTNSQESKSTSTDDSKALQSSQVKEVKPVTDSEHTLDIYV